MFERLDDATVRFFIDDDLVAGLVLDELQDSFPWFMGALVEGPAVNRWRALLDHYHAAGLEHDYAPYHPHEAPYEDSDLAKYVAALTQLRADLAANDFDALERAAEDDWRSPWIDAPLATLDAYLAFLDWRRWRAVDRNGTLVDGIALPPALDLASRRYGFRPGDEAPRYPYVGPERVREDARGQPEGAPITSREALAAWLAQHPEGCDDAATFVVDAAGVLRLAPRRTEHVACAGGRDVQAAGEVTFTRDGRGVAWCSNQSSGYCPEPASAAALGRARDDPRHAHRALRRRVRVAALLRVRAGHPTAVRPGHPRSASASRRSPSARRISPIPFSQ